MGAQRGRHPPTELGCLLADPWGLAGDTAGSRRKTKTQQQPPNGTIPASVKARWWLGTRMHGGGAPLANGPNASFESLSRSRSVESMA